MNEIGYIWEEDDEANLSPEEYWSAEEDMDCPNNVLDEDGERICKCGDEGRACESCAAEELAEHAWMRGVPLSSVTGVLSEDEEQDLRDAGRGHLV